MVEGEEAIKKLEGKLLTYLENKDFFNDIIKDLEKVIVGEDLPKKCIVLCAYGGRLIENSEDTSFNLSINDEAGLGKDYITTQCLKYLPETLFEKRTRISPTVLNYWHNSKDEPTWTWDSKVLYLEDIESSILNHPVFKVMCSGGSDVSITINNRVVDLKVNGKPVIIITTANTSPSNEVSRRFVIVPLDASTDQTQEICKRWGEFRKEGIIPKLDMNIKYAMEKLKQVNVSIPFTENLHKRFPMRHRFMRTNYPRFLDWISASAGLHQYQRKKDENGFIIAEGQDYEIARECFLYLTSNKLSVSLSLHEQKVLEVLEVNTTIKGTYSYLHANYFSGFMSDRTTQKKLDNLTKLGILETELFINSQNKEETHYKLSSNYFDQEELLLPTYDELMDTPSIPSKPSTPSTPSKPSIPNKKIDNNEPFLDKEVEVQKVPKVMKVNNVPFDLEEEQIKERRKIREDFTSD